MSFNRADRFNKTLQKNLAEIFLVDMNNPVLKSINILDIQVAKDLKSAHVIYDSLLDENQITTQLDKAKGFIKKLLSKKMYLKFIPELKFFYGRDLESTRGDRR